MAPAQSLLRRFRRDESGVSALEFALASAFILAPLLLGATELGRRAWVKTQFENAAQAGVEYATVIGCPNGPPCSFPNIQSAVQNAAPNWLGPKMTITGPAACGGAYYCFGCPGASGIALSATSSGCGAGGTSGTYAGLTASYTYTPLFKSCGYLLPSSICSTTPTTWSFTALARVY
jgi:Flp pilus assembly pilin Flp